MALTLSFAMNGTHPWLVSMMLPTACFCFLMHAFSFWLFAGAIEVGEELFFDPASSGDLGRQGSGVSQSSALSSLGKASSGALASPRAQPQQDLAEFTLKLRRPGTKDYEGVDTSLDVSLNTLFFYCNRPTVAALISMGLDLSAAASAGKPAAAAGGDAGGGDAAGGVLATAAAVDAGAMAAQGGEPEALQLLSSNGGGAAGNGSGDGGAGRKMFAMNVTLRTLQVVLNYEGSGQAACSQACMQDFSFALGIAPDGGMEITSALGNITAVSEGQCDLICSFMQLLLLKLLHHSWPSVAQHARFSFFSSPD